METVEVQTSAAETSKREEGEKVNEPSEVVASSTKSNEDKPEVDQAQETGSAKNNRYASALLQCVFPCIKLLGLGCSRPHAL